MAGSTDISQPTTREKPTGRRRVPPARGRRGAVRWVRLAVQVAFFVLAPATFSMAFAGARYLCACIGRGDAVELTSFVVLLCGLCVYTVLFGRFFCGWVCAFGTLGDVLYQAGDFVLRRLGVKRKAAKPAERKLAYLKYVVLALLLVASFVGASSIVATVSPWTAYGRLVNFQWLEMNVVGAALLALVMVGMVARERFFCRYLCPLGAIFALLPKAAWGKVLKLGGPSARARLMRAAVLAAVLFAFFFLAGAVNYLPTPTFP